MGSHGVNKKISHTHILETIVNNPDVLPTLTLFPGRPGLGFTIAAQNLFKEKKLKQIIQPCSEEHMLLIGKALYEEAKNKGERKRIPLHIPSAGKAGYYNLLEPLLRGGKPLGPQLVLVSISHFPNLENEVINSFNIPYLPYDNSSIKYLMESNKLTDKELFTYIKNLEGVAYIVSVNLSTSSHIKKKWH